eukprot:CAMPEP_0197639212 /NCGR_PEP_ID=MMETSP1338-20131121/13902_1 /TAXON_ID=43686 ORGANISM="Pelagodinium beii, Strain RCC1491" /NCGR_SAMPLE_ID=MMETSP1338 /ASSEMBLY_ACC=CAM_ASM_000754 /LENGTH=503 /DNA_ID=CAMNT_0043211907 /DNA_START=51 /DNA_END=1559 /DNA_ORIENTATION=-
MVSQAPGTGSDWSSWSGWNDSSWSQNRGWNDNWQKGQNWNGWGEKEKSDWTSEWYGESSADRSAPVETSYEETSVDPGHVQETSTLSTVAQEESLEDNSKLKDASPQSQAAQGISELDEQTNATRRSKVRRPHGQRLWCHVFLNKRHPEFDLVPMLIGRKGHNMHQIHKATNAKVRVRGRGSGHLEASSQKEAPVPLMVAVTSEGVHKVHFVTAVQMTIDRLNDVQHLFKQFCEQRDLGAIARERIWRFGEMSKEAEVVLADLIAESVCEGDYWSTRPPEKGSKYWETIKAQEAQASYLMAEEAKAQGLPQPVALAPGLTPPGPPSEAPPPDDWMSDSFAMGHAYGGYRGYPGGPGAAQILGSQWQLEMPYGMDDSKRQLAGHVGETEASAAAAAALQNFSVHAMDLPPGLPPGLWNSTGVDWGNIEDNSQTGSASQHATMSDLYYDGALPGHLEGNSLSSTTDSLMAHGLATSLKQKAVEGQDDIEDASEDEADLQGLIESE